MFSGAHAACRKLTSDIHIRLHSQFQSLSPLIQMSSSAWRDAILLCPLAYFISVSVSPPCSLLLILSHSYGGRDENGCLIMQRGQPIKGPGLSDLKAYSEHSWREQEREGDREMGWGLIVVWHAGHISSTYHWSCSSNNCR